jgi:hypothetical protein
VTAADVITAWDRADPDAIHPTRRVSEDAYWASGKTQAAMLASVIPDGAKVLDFGCGDGRVAVPLAGLGYEVTAVDSSQRMLDRLTERAPDLTTVQRHGRRNRRASRASPHGRRVRACRPHPPQLRRLPRHHRTDCGPRPSSAGPSILDWPVSETPSEADSWIGVTTWSREQQTEACARIGLEPVDSGLPWGVYRAVKVGG